MEWVSAEPDIKNISSKQDDKQVVYLPSIKIVISDNEQDIKQNIPIKLENEDNKDQYLETESHIIKSPKSKFENEDNKDQYLETESHIIKSPKSAHVCVTCGKVFTFLSKLETHQRTHSGVKPFKCEHCSKAFSCKGNLIVHQRIHSGIKPFVCKICSKAFSFCSTYIRHQASHSNKKKRFRKKDCYIAHENTRSSDILPGGSSLLKQLKTDFMSDISNSLLESPSSKHICSICGKGFSYLSKLETHLRTHNGLKPFKCDDCPKAFASKGNLIVHQRIHTGIKPFVCEICSKAFSFCSTFIHHQATHSENKPFSCNVCQKRFRRKDGLIIHLKTHSDLKPLQCLQCGTFFKYSNLLQRHKKNCNRIDLERDSSDGFPQKKMKFMQCMKCGVFFSLRSFKKHENICDGYHSKQKTFECSFCGLTLCSQRLEKHESICKGHNFGNKPIGNKNSYRKKKKIQCGKCGIFLKDENSLPHHKKYGCSMLPEIISSNIEQPNLSTEGPIKYYINHLAGEQPNATCEAPIEYYINNPDGEHANASTENAVEYFISNPGSEQPDASTQGPVEYFINNPGGEADLATQHIILSEINQQDLNLIKIEEVPLDPNLVNIDNIKQSNREDGSAAVLSCQHCGKTFSAPSKLEIHLRIHSGVRPFQCNKCYRCFIQKIHLNKHLMKKHAGETLQFNLNEKGSTMCGNEMLDLNSQINLFTQNKQKSINTNSNNRSALSLVCRHCGKECSAPSKLLVHSRIHSGIKPFSCPKCVKCFKQKIHLKVHLHKIHKDNEVNLNANQTCETSINIEDLVEAFVK